VAVLNTSPSVIYGGIWMSGGAPAIDTDGTMYLGTGNGPYAPDTRNWGNAILKLPVDRPTVIDSKVFRPLDYFSPFNRDSLNSDDLDLGSGGVMLLPNQSGGHPRLMVLGSKQGLLYVVDRDQLTAVHSDERLCTDEELARLAESRQANPSPTWSESCDAVVQVVKIRTDGLGADAPASTYRGSALFSTPAYWNGHVYVAAHGDHLKMFAVRDGLLVNTPESVSADVFENGGATVSISANGIRDGVVWALASRSEGVVLYAFDAANLSRVLFKSSGTAVDQQLGISRVGNLDAITSRGRFLVPTVYDGKVFVATSGRLNVFGLVN
jgi:hypothetical protein